MFKRLFSAKFPLMVYNPPAVAAADYLDAVHRAGAQPVLDTEFLDTASVLATVAELSGRQVVFGLRLMVDRRDLLARLAQSSPGGLDTLVLAYRRPEDLENPDLIETPWRRWIEVRDMEMETLLTPLDPHGLIVRGHEAPGRVAPVSSFILMQAYLSAGAWPVIVHGGVGWYTAAGLLAAGAGGLVLDDQLYLCSESPLASRFKELMSRLEEKDTAIIDTAGEGPCRVFGQLGTRVVKALKTMEAEAAEDPEAARRLQAALIDGITPLDDPVADPAQSLFPLGQDAVLARHFADRGPDLQRIIEAFLIDTGARLVDIDDNDPLVADSPLAGFHGTRYPIVQGPMANVSDKGAFARAVLEAGGLPFLAMGSLPAHLSEAMLASETGGLPRFGAGLIGIEALNQGLPAHLEQVRRHRVPFALIAGGVPAQVRALEADGIPTYLHTPSLAMLENAIAGGCRRFIFEGTEAGGHVGHLSSLVLWELATARLAAQADERLAEQTLIFAGGIGTAFGSHFISGLTSHLARRGAKIGIQIGSAYLFTEEIVATGAITALYQKVVCRERCTLVMGRTVGLAARTVPTPFSRRIVAEEFRRLRERMPLKERKEAFERDNIGALLIGAKAFCPDFERPGKAAGEACLTYFEEEDQYQRGNFMVGEALAFATAPFSIADLHARLMGGKQALVDRLNALELATAADGQLNDEIAVVGMGCILPEAADPSSLWQLILDRRDAIGPMPAERLDPELYHDPDHSAPDKSYSAIAGLVSDFVFDHRRFGYTREKAARLSRSQQMVLQAAYQAAADAGMLDADDHLPRALRPRTSVIVGSCLGNELSSALHLKYALPEIRACLERIEAFRTLPPDEQESLVEALRQGLSNGSPYEPVHGVALNMEAARIAHHLGATGRSYAVDAACATSLAALDCGVKELMTGLCDLAVVGGVNTNLAPESFVGFCKMGALSATGSFPFDERADGFVLGEGAAVVVLKRFRDARRDGDRIYGIIRAVGSGSDGKGKAIAAPSAKGQAMTLKRCLDGARRPVDPAEVDFIEAHGTGTRMGDLVELETLKKVYGGETPKGISSIKSQIGHLLGAAGMAGLIKALLALNHRILPPNGRFERLGSKHDLSDSGLFIVTDSAPWEAADGNPRLAAVSAYGFGGINYHVVVAEDAAATRPLPRRIFADPGFDPDEKRIVVCGLGTVLPGATDVEQFWHRLCEGTPRLQPMPAERFDNPAYAAEPPDSPAHIPLVQAGIVDNYRFDHARFRIPPTAARFIDRAQQFALAAADQAIAAAGLDARLAPGNRVAVVMGTLAGEKYVENIVRTRIPLLERLIRQAGDIDPRTKEVIADALAGRLRDRYLPNTEDTVPGLLSNIVSARVSKHFGCNGANFTVDASCASATVALDLAVRGLKTGDYEAAITGGVDCNLMPGTLLAFKRLGLISDGECRVFDHQAKGYVMSEGAAVLVLATLGYARRHGMPVLAEISATGFDASAPAHLLSPSPEAYKEAMQRCYRQVPVHPADVAHLDVFGVANPFFDALEAHAAAQVFPRPVGFGNVKTEFGYFKAANPAVVLAKLTLMASRRRLLPFFGYRPETTIVEKDAILVARRQIEEISRNRPIHLAANVNGIGGNHGHVLVSTLPAHLAQAQTHAGAEGVDRIAAGEWQPVERGLAVLFSGQGAQYPGMMAEIYRNRPGVRAVMDRGEAIFKAHHGRSLLEMMFDARGAEALNRTETTQPAVFLAGAALWDLMAGRGLRPDYVVGHSLGEITALYASGTLAFEDAMALVMERGRLMQAAAERHPGKIMVVFEAAGQVADRIREAGVADVRVTNKNSRRQTAVCGPSDAMDAFGRYLKTQGVVGKVLPLSGAFHTPLMAEAAAGLETFLEEITLRPEGLARVVANVTAAPYPVDPAAAKGLLVRQLVSPVEFVASIEGLHRAGCRAFLEIGPGRLLANLLKDIPLAAADFWPVIDPKADAAASLEKALARLAAENRISPRPEAATLPAAAAARHTPPEPMDEADSGFQAFLAENSDRVRRVLEAEYEKHRREKALADLERFGFCGQPIVIAGVSVGLPGTGNKVFNDNNFDKLLAGRNFIEPLTRDEKERILDMNITRVFKEADGSARLVNITRIEEVIQLAGKLGYFNLKSEYGIEPDYDITIALSIAAGIEALHDAHIPLVQQFRETSAGARIPDGYGLPAEMQTTTGVILTSLFPGFETLIDQMNNYYYNKFYVKPYKDLEKIYYHLMESVRDEEIKEQITDWFFKIKERRKRYGNYKFNRNLLFDVVPLGSAHFAQLIKAKGPNMQMSGACASTTQAIGVAEDWIRAGRCERVIIIGGEAATSPVQSPWIASGFLAMGAATVKNVVEEAAKPFDAERNGTILGSGAVGLVVERADTVAERGLAGQAEILGTRIGNSAYHGTRIDVAHVAGEMQRFVADLERRHGLRSADYAPRMVFMSHETFTPARGGSAEAEVEALRRTYPDHYRQIVITNTKGFTGHTLGAAIEDAVLVKALQQRRVPPIANLSRVPEAFADLKFSAGQGGDFQYGLHFSAGFGSHFAFLMLRRIEEKAAAGNPVYAQWLRRVTGLEDPVPVVSNHTLVVEGAPPVTRPVPVPAAEPAPVKAEKAIPAAMQTAAPEAVLAAPAATVDVVAAVQQIIAEQTGYTVDMLDSALDLEADLGIDTVKQVETFGRISRHFDLAVPEDLRLAELNTIDKISGYIRSQLGQGAATAPEEAAAVAAAPDQAPETGRDIVAAVQQIIAEQTGYTVDMLDSALDLEADLGIDTVKQVETFGRISRHFGLAVPEDLRLAELNTIDKIAGYIRSQLGGAAAVPAEGETAVAVASTEGAQSETSLADGGTPAVSRFEPRVTALEDLPPPVAGALADRKLLVICDRHGLWPRVATRLGKAGIRIVTLGQGGKMDYRCDFLDPVESAATIDRVLADHPDLNGLVHLMPVDAFLDGGGGESRAEIAVAVKSLFAAVQRLQPRLVRDGLVAAVSFNSVVFAYDRNGQPVHPAFAGMAGLLKTVAREIPEARVKMVDLAAEDPGAALDEAADALAAEIGGPDRRVEVGYRNGRRFGLRLLPAAPAEDGALIADGDTVLVTGGARGITFAILQGLAARWRGELVVLGRSEIRQEDPELDSAVDEAAIISILRRRHPETKPVDLRRSAVKVLAARQSRDNLEKLCQAGIRVRYQAVDVTDAEAVAQTLEAEPRVNVLVHAAGLEESQPLAKKSLSQFSRVFDTKVLGMSHLLDALRAHPLRSVIGFSSVTARLGNAGQSDYTAANDMLGRMLQCFQQRHPETVCKALAWTAWNGAGMATRETVRRVLTQRGLTFLPLEQGVGFFLDELKDTTTPEAVFTGLDRAMDPDGLLDAAAPFIDALVKRSAREAVFQRTLEMERDRFLDDHTRAGVPIFLGATGIETMAEAAVLHDGRGRVPVALTDFHIPYGIKLLKGRPKPIEITTRQDGDNAYRCTIDSHFVDPAGRRSGEAKRHFEGRFELAGRWPGAPRVQWPDLPRPAAPEDVQALLYHPRRLFMDGLFRTVTRVDGFDGQRLLVGIAHPASGDFFAGVTDPPFVTDVQLIDAMFQTGGMLEVLTSGDIVLPYGIRRLRWYGPPRRGVAYRCLTERTASAEKTITYRLTLAGEDDRAVVEIEGFEMVKVDRLRPEDRIAERLVGDLRRAS
jgi:acyl transferase domain-containing protein/NAD(P)H-dependent flavin oxidoreductase YrpB (nitropropane dioxygenase family)/NAD(P)-dependent dehydrogenase (short-subunit alcohol dehydrogenase family)